uniref:Retrotransposon protein, putative, unclassified n=1 Tax=Oryza sativa subsp. japonica TaxID=39947 RepID=Q2R4N2_ORYSJ|nr:retrotransposon protein, putative, unclassified [Oryza sativa Japonica Group]
MAEKPPLSPSPASPGIVKEKIQKLGLTDVNEGNVVPIVLEKFTPDQKKDFDVMMQQARDQFLNSFMQTHKGTLVQKYKVKGGNLNYQYQPASPQAQYQPGGLAQPQFASQYGQFEPMQQQSLGAVQQRPWADVIADVMREQFGLKPKEAGSLYQQPYPECWADLEKQFHSYFYSGVHEMKLSDLTVIKQWHDEPVHEYIQRFREMRNKCFSLSLTDAQLADLAFQGMVAPIREKFSSEDFDRLSHLIQKVTLHEHRSDDDEDDSEIAAAEWVRSKKVIPCQWVKSSGKEERYDFDITKADKIFDLLLREKQIQLPAGHIIPSAEELGKNRYCKWHNSGSHTTNDCKVFRQQIQAAIEGGKIKFDDSKTPMKVDGNPFPVNMVHTAGQTADGGRVRGFQMNSAKIINKYQRKYDKQQEKHYEADDDGFDPHWSCVTS